MRASCPPACHAWRMPPAACPPLPSCRRPCRAPHDLHAGTGGAAGGPRAGRWACRRASSWGTRWASIRAAASCGASCKRETPRSSGALPLRCGPRQPPLRPACLAGACSAAGDGSRRQRAAHCNPRRTSALLPPAASAPLAQPPLDSRCLLSSSQPAGGQGHCCPRGAGASLPAGRPPGAREDGRRVAAQAARKVETVGWRGRGAACCGRAPARRLPPPWLW